MRERLRRYWWIFLPVAVVVVLANELADQLSGDKKGHPFADLILAIIVVGIVLYVWGYTVRRRRERSKGASGD